MKKAFLYLPYLIILGLGGLIIDNNLKSKNEEIRRNGIENKLRKNFFLAADQRDSLDRELTKSKINNIKLELKKGILENNLTRLSLDYKFLEDDCIVMGKSYKQDMENYLNLIKENSELMMELEIERSINKSLIKNIPCIPYNYSGQICSK